MKEKGNSSTHPEGCRGIAALGCCEGNISVP